MAITVEVVSRGVDWAPIAAAFVTAVAAVGGIWGTARQAKNARKAATKDAEDARNAATEDLNRNLKAAAENLQQSISREDRRARDAKKALVYAEFLRSISESYAKAKAEGQAKAKSRQSDTPEAKPRQNDKSKTEFPQGDTPEDVDILVATSAIELFANEEISKAARKLSDNVRRVHEGLRAGNLDENGNLDESEVPDINADRLNLVEQFKKDLRIQTDDEPQASKPRQPSNPSSAAPPERSGTSGQPDQPSSS